VRAAYAETRATGVLVTVRSPEVTFTHTFPATKHTRYPSLVAAVRRAVAGAAAAGVPLPPVTFLVIVNDGSHPRAAAFGPARHWRSWARLIPAPLGNARGAAAGYGTELTGWDAHVAATLAPSRGAYPWAGKTPRALFRGNLAMQTHALGTCNAGGACRRAASWRQVARGAAWAAAAGHPRVLDVGFTSTSAGAAAAPDALRGAPPTVPPVPFLDQQAWRALLVVGSNQDWAERVRPLLCLGSVLLLHAAETVEWFTPLLRPWVHYVPVGLHFEDLVPAAEWAVAPHGGGREMVARMNALAEGVLTEAVMVDYWADAIRMYGARQAAADAAAAR